MGTIFCNRKILSRPMNKLALVILLSVCLTGFTYYLTFPGDFESRSAADKLKWFKGIISTDNGSSSSYYGILDLAKLPLPEVLFGQPLGVVSTNTEDQITKGRKKLIHTVAKVAAIEFRMENHSAGYTGHLAPGVKSVGFARMSSAKEPTWDFKNMSGKNTPGISFKILRDGKPSANFMAMWRLDGQESPNFFKHPMSHHVHNIPESFTLNPDIIALQILTKKFKQYDNDPNMIGISQLGNMRPDGYSVKNNKSPFQLVFQPNPAVTAVCNSGLFDKDGHYECLAKIAANSQLYKIYAMNAPNANPQTSDLTLIGSVWSTSQFLNSKTFDEQVQFAHVFWAQEVAAMGTTGKMWQGATRGSYGDTAGAPKFVGILPNF